MNVKFVRPNYQTQHRKTVQKTPTPNTHMLMLIVKFLNGKHSVGKPYGNLRASKLTKQNLTQLFFPAEFGISYYICVLLGSALFIWLG